MQWITGISKTPAVGMSPIWDFDGEGLLKFELAFQSLFFSCTYTMLDLLIVVASFSQWQAVFKQFSSDTFSLITKYGSDSGRMLV